MIELARHTALPDPELCPEIYDDTPTKRALAWVVDVVAAGVMTAILVPFTAFTALFYLPLLYLVVSFCYRWSTLSRGSATWGMRLMAVEIRRGDGAPLDPATAFAHTLAYAVSWTLLPLQIVSGALMAVTARRQGLGDHVLGTAAVNRSL